ncbi:hypothetical protein KIPB_006502, partial [Kipferlia bialata]
VRGSSNDLGQLTDKQCNDLLNPHIPPSHRINLSRISRWDKVRLIRELAGQLHEKGVCPENLRTYVRKGKAQSPPTQSHVLLAPLAKQYKHMTQPNTCLRTPVPATAREMIRAAPLPHSRLGRADTLSQVLGSVTSAYTGSVTGRSATSALTTHSLASLGRRGLGPSGLSSTSTYIGGPATPSTPFLEIKRRYRDGATYLTQSVIISGEETIEYYRKARTLIQRLESWANSAGGDGTSVFRDDDAPRTRSRVSHHPRSTRSKHYRSPQSQFNEELENILSDLRNVDPEMLYLEVPKDKNLRYSFYIKHPTSLKQIERSVRVNKISSRLDFAKAIGLMICNTYQFNIPIGKENDRGCQRESLVLTTADRIRQTCLAWLLDDDTASKLDALETQLFKTKGKSDEEVADSVSTSRQQAQTLLSSDFWALGLEQRRQRSIEIQMKQALGISVDPNEGLPPRSKRRPR